MVDTNWVHEIERDARDFKEKNELFSMTDALGDYARRLKRNLLTWSALLFVCVYYDLKITKIPTIDVEIPGGEKADALAVIVAVPLLYSLISFLVQAGADLLHWRQRFERGVATFTGNAMHRAAQHLHIIAQYLEKSEPGAAISSEFGAAANNAKEAIAQTNDHLRALLSDARRLTRGRKLFAYSWELVLPVLAALATLFYARSALIEATTAFLSSL